jgi:hypothetical protein
LLHVKQTHKGGKGTALAIDKAGPRAVSAALLLVYPRGKRSDIHCTEAGWALGPVWMGLKNLPLHPT